MAMFAARFLRRISEKLSRGIPSQITFVGLVLIIFLAWPTIRVIKFDLAISGQDTRTSALQWIQNNIPRDKIIGMEWYNYCPQLENRGQYLARLYSKNENSITTGHNASIEWKYQKVSQYLSGNVCESEYKIHYLWNSNNEITEKLIKQREIDYVILSSANYGRFFYRICHQRET